MTAVQGQVGSWAYPCNKDISHFFTGGSQTLSLCRRWTITGTVADGPDAPPSAKFCAECAERLTRMTTAQTVRV